MRAFLVSLVLLALVGCAGPGKKVSAFRCPSKDSVPYFDVVQGFGICLPAEATKTVASGATPHAVLFRNLPIPENTNLKSKQLAIIAGDYRLFENATPSGHFISNGLTFARRTFEEGSAGHLSLHIIYTWQRVNGSVHFDFEHRSVNVNNVDLSQRPAEYDRSAQIKLSEEVMSTVKPLH